MCPKVTSQHKQEVDEVGLSNQQLNAFLKMDSIELEWMKYLFWPI